MERLIRKVWNELLESVDKQEFDPKNEEEMRICVCYFLIRHLIERFGTAKGLHVPKHPHENKQTDIRYKDQLYVENKHILRSGIRTDERWELRRNLAEADIKKLQAIKKRQPDATCVFTVFAPTYKAEDAQNYYNDVRDWCEKAEVIFLNAWKTHAHARMDENTFRDKVIADLRKLGIPIISLGTGTFDSYVEEVGLVELKKLGWNPKYRRAAIEFTKDQTKEMKLLRKKPFVLVFGNDKKERYYIMKPEDMLQKLSTRMKWQTMWITEDKIPSKRIDSYEDFIKTCLEALRE